MLERLTANAKVIGNNLSAALDFDDPKTAKEILAALRAEPDITGACVFKADGRVFAVYDNAADVVRFEPPAASQTAGHAFTRGRLLLFQPIQANGDVVGTIYIESNTRELWVLLTQYSVIIGLVYAVTLLVALWLSNRMQRLISTPILELVQTMRIVAQDKNYSVRARSTRSDEIGSLISGFNDMLSQIQERDEKLEQRVAERTEELRESQALYSSLVEQMPAGVFRKDREGRYVFVNASFCRLKGIQPGDYLGKLPSELSAAAVSGPLGSATDAADLIRRAPEHHECILQTGKTLKCEEKYTGADGTVFYFHSIKSPVFGADGRVVGSQGILFDITERVRAQTELNYERNLLRALLDNSDDCIYFKDTESRFLRCSTHMAERFGTSDLREVIGKRDRDFYGKEHAEEAFADEQGIIRTGEPVKGKVERENWPDGHVTWALTSKLPLRDENGKVVGTFGISKDITDLKMAEEKLDQIHKQLVEASRQAGMAEVATSVLHNVGNVLNSINISSSLISDKLVHSRLPNLRRAAALLGEHEKDLADFLTRDSRGHQLPGYFRDLAEQLIEEQKDLRQEAAALAANIVHVKEIVSMQQNYARSAGVREVVQITELVEDSLRMNDGAIKRHDISVCREYANVAPILTERHKVLQILVNLIRNAKYACDDSGRTDKQITLRVAEAREVLRISVIDNGVGIPAENLTRIFNHGFTTRKEGHGFGLHSGALAARELGGRLQAFSDGPNRGATFTLE
ncbi:MAG TPA: PAS domain S-box protein, partial [Verrucomicrobiae bacterium]|nr:PAS domain S-box protein [Verrucomicrobiae bacterium]